MFGALKLHGPVITTNTENDTLTGATNNPYTWAKKHNVIYIDNPVGAGYSYSNKLPTTNDDVTDNLYEFLQQWYRLFPEYQATFLQFLIIINNLSYSKGKSIFCIWRVLCWKICSSYN